MDGDTRTETETPTVTQRLMRQLLERVDRLSAEKKQLEQDNELLRQEIALRGQHVG